MALGARLEKTEDGLLKGLLSSPKTVSPKYLYDETGCRLFNEICGLPEYYQTRTEAAILESSADEIAWIMGARCILVEYGSGSSMKTEILLRKLHSPAAYIGIDIAPEALNAAAARLKSGFPSLPIHQVCADFMGNVELPKIPQRSSMSRVLGFFPGSTIGNLEPRDAISFLRRTRALVGDRGYFIVGVDLIKNIDELEAAYNDAQGITSAFNLNLIDRINREFDANLDRNAFEHRSFFNMNYNRIEMHLISKKSFHADVAGRSLHFSAGESIHTENSYKYTVSTFSRLAGDAGYTVARRWSDEQERFAVFCLKA